MLGLAGMLLMASADTKDVEATGKISYESENVQEDTVRTAGLEAAACSLAVEEKAVWEEATITGDLQVQNDELLFQRLQ